MQRYLYDSRSIAQELRKLFSKETRNHRRVVVCAFVGSDAASLLPDYKGVELYCWPKVGSTDPAAIRALQDLGARVRFVEGLHAKVYWVERCGFIITSANLSSNALGQKCLHEVGVFCSNSPAYDIERLTDRLHAHAPSPAELRAFVRRHNAFWSMHKASVGHTPRASRRQSGNFSTWCNQGSGRPLWKFGWWYSEGVCPSSIRKQVLELDNGREPQDFISCRRDDYRPGDWLLCWKWKDQARRIRTEDLSWMFVDRVLRLSKADRAKESGDTHYAVQVYKRSNAMIEPFRIDSDFRFRFTEALRQRGTKRFRDENEQGKLRYRPTAAFLALLRRTRGRRT